VDAPEAVRLSELPAQIEVVELDALTVGTGTTVTILVTELVHVPLLPTTV
jgi:hypothetical protein